MSGHQISLIAIRLRPAAIHHPFLLPPDEPDCAGCGAPGAGRCGTGPAV